MLAVFIFKILSFLELTTNPCRVSMGFKDLSFNKVGMVLKSFRKIK